MAPDEPSGARPGPVVLRIKLRYDDVETMIQRFAPNVGKTGLFLPTKSLQPIGAEIKFELRLSTDQPVLVGLGRVKASRAPDPENPKATFGLSVELMRVTRESRDLILRMLERRKLMGMPETSIPMPVDIDAARRGDFIDTGVKDATSGAVPHLVSAADSAPASSSFTAPRRQTGPIAVAKVAVVDPLPPEPQRRKRVPVAELIASASGPVAVAPLDGLDENVDVAAVLARARVLVGSDLDGELEALRDSMAAPVHLDIEAASAELARQLGGAAVRRDRSARWAPPPPTASEPIAPAPVEPPAVEPEVVEQVAAPEPAATEITPEPAPRARSETRDIGERAIIDMPEPARRPRTETRDIGEREIIAAPEPAPTEIDEQIHSREGYIRDEPDDLDEPTPISAIEHEVPTQDDDDAPLFARPSSHGQPLIHDDADASQFEEDGSRDVEPAQIHDEIHRLADGDYEELENTQIGEPAPVDEAALAERLDQQLDDAEREDLGFSETVDAALAGLGRGVDSEGFALEEPPVSGDFVMPFQQATYEQPQDRRDDSLEVALAAAVNEEEDIEEIEEIDDFEILAEADAEDADLLVAAAEREISRPQTRPSFLNRLALDDEAVPQEQDEFAHEPGEIDPVLRSAGHALRGFEEPEGFTPVPRDPYGHPVGEQSYTFANDLPGDEFDAPHNQYAPLPSGFIPPDAFDQSDVIAIGPSPLQAAEDFPDLESALEALDVDLDDLGRPAGRRGRSSGDDIPTSRSGGPLTLGTQPTESPRPVRSTGGGRVVTPAPVPKSGRVHKRATTEDGILIDFDDEDS
jgi:hypothetical protein